MAVKSSTSTSRAARASVKNSRPRTRALFLGGNGLAVKLVAEHVPASADAFRFGERRRLRGRTDERHAVPEHESRRRRVRQSDDRRVLRQHVRRTFPRAQKTTGFDAIALHGSADDLSYVSITADGATVEPAADLAGLDTYETCERVREQEGVGYDTHARHRCRPGRREPSALRLPVARVETARRRRRSGRQRGGSRLEERESRRRPGGRLRARNSLRPIDSGRSLPGG